ncbi:acyl-CoA dehydrogenase C-terminal domain-containing protein, partial [Streptomyces sp. NPDC079189]|uniref:acyl-CoA dehydrogenase C-terminal domain-containing protein n=1 Tax=Streptomyces sp. NPDC079189 TaxID=3154514 RepID=UPI0034396090
PTATMMIVMLPASATKTDAGCHVGAGTILWSTGDPATALANASVYLEAVGHVVLAWIWLEQFLALRDDTDDFHEGKRQAARYFFRVELPRTGPQFDLLDSLDHTAADSRPEWF